MANDSTGMGPASSEQDATPINDSYFTDMQGDEDAFFGPEQLAQANTGTDGNPVIVPVPQDQNVIRVQVNPGEILELASPFDANADLLARVADGNLAIKVGDVTVILLGYVDANGSAPVVVETSDGKPIDVATLVASTDPNIEIQTAAGPGEAGQGGQGADNTGALLSQLEGGAGLGGLNSVGAQDQTELNYSNIDNSILKEFQAETALLAGGATPFSGLQEPFLIDPANTTPYTNFSDFFKDYKADVEASIGWADFTGTKADANGDLDAYLAKTAFTQEIAHSSSAADPFRIELTLLESQVSALTSDGKALHVDFVNSTTDTVFIRREGDGALVLVIHAHEPGDLSDTSTPEGTGPYQLDTFLINRLDHPDPGNDILGLTIPYSITHTGVEQEPTIADAHVDILDDIPEAHDPTYWNIVHGVTTGDGLAEAKSSSTTTQESNDYGHVDEDWLRWGNHDKDNNPSGVDGDKAHGDDIGDRFVCGTLDINFGADGPAGAGGNDYCSDDERDERGGLAGLLVTPSSPALQLQNFQDKDGNFVSGKDQDTFTSHGHTLIVLDHYTDCCGIEHLVVGYHDEKPTDVLFAPSGGEGWSCDTVVFTLTLNVNPDDSNFQQFTFKLQGPLDHPDTKTAESNLLLDFSVLATDDDGDHPIAPVDIKIQVNDDSPLVCDAVYYNENNPVIIGLAEATSGVTTFKDTIGRVDEDWLQPNGNEDCEIKPVDDGQGTTHLCGHLNIKYGGDGPGDAANDQQQLASALPANVALALNTGLSEGDTFPGVKSGGHALVVLDSSSGYLAVGIPGDSETKPQLIFTLSLNTDPDSSNFQQFDFNLFGPLDHKQGDNTESTDSDILLDFKVIAHDYDGDKADTSIKILVNDDTPEAHDDNNNVLDFPASIAEPVGAAKGDVLFNDWTGADTPTLVTAIAFGAGAGKAVDADGTSIQGDFGLLTIHSDGTYDYALNDKGKGGDLPSKDVFHYTIADFDGDKSTADLTITVNGCSFGIAKDTLTSISRVGDDTGEGGHGNGHNDLIFGTDSDDTLTSLHGATKLSGGAGDDTFLNIDVADLDGSNTLDGTHSIDGGKGTDTLDLSHLASFDSAQAARVENVEVLDFTGGGATAVTLDYSAAYGITQVGGLHAFTIKGDSSDSVTLNPSDGQSWTQTGTDVVGSDGHLYNVFEAGAGAAKVTVTIEHGVTVDAS